jgi:hypothetical protein
MPRRRIIQTCTLEYCYEKYYARGFCRKHYRRWLRKGTTSIGEMDDLIQKLGAQEAEIARKIHLAHHLGPYETCKICQGDKNDTHQENRSIRAH